MEQSLTGRFSSQAAALIADAADVPAGQWRLLCASRAMNETWLGGDTVEKPTYCTIWELADELAKCSLTLQELRAITPLEMEALVGEVWCALSKVEQDEAKTALGIGSSVVRSLTATLYELRMAGITGESLEPEAFVSKTRGKLFATIQDGYERLLKERNLADPAKVFSLACDRLLDQDDPTTLHLILPDWLRFHGLMQTVLDQFPFDQLTKIKYDIVPSHAITRNVERLAWLEDPQDAPSAIADETVRIYRALSPEYEVRAVLGTILQQGIPLENCEVLYSTEGDYPALFQSMLALAMPDRQTELPLTFSNGMPVGWTRPGRGLRLWLNWIKSKLAPELLAELVLLELVKLPAGLSKQEVITLLHAAPVCISEADWERYLKRVKQEPAHEPFIAWMRALLLHHRTAPTRVDAAWQAANHFLEEVLQIRDDADQQTQQAVIALIHSLKEHGAAETQEVWQRLDEWIESSTLTAATVEPGCLLMTPYGSQGLSRRSHTFCVGLSEDQFPQLPAQASLLTDRERKKLSPELEQQTRRELLHAQERSLTRWFSETTGQLMLTYPCADQAEDRELFPSQLLMRAFRLCAGLPEGDLFELESWLPAPLGPDAPLCRITQREQWLNRMPAQPYHDSLFRQDFPLLCRGAYARKQRSSYQFTEHDGWVTAAGAEFDLQRSKRVFSANSLEQYAKCPLQFFYQHVLRLEPMEEAAQPDQWLTPQLRGIVLHGVFHQYHLCLLKEKRRPDQLADVEVLQDILRKQLEAHRDKLPVVPEYIREAELQELQATLLIFLTEETKCADRTAPRFFETALGMPQDGPRSALDTSEPVSVRLPSGRTISLRGRVDRIDEVAVEGDKASTKYFIWDYKTGRITEYQGDAKRNTGQLLQPLIYVEMVERRLRETGQAASQVVGAGYFFPGQLGGQGDRIEWTAEDLRKNVRVLDTIIDLMQAGIFLPTEDEKTCEWCAFSQACDTEQVNKQAKSKMKQCSGTTLKQLWQLRRPS